MPQATMAKCLCEKYGKLNNRVFPKWNGNSVKSGNLIKHWNIDWAQFKDTL